MILAQDNAVHQSAFNALIMPLFCDRA